MVILNDRLTYYIAWFCARVFSEELCTNWEVYFFKLYFKYHYNFYLALRYMLKKSWFIRQTFEKKKK